MTIVPERPSCEICKKKKPNQLKPNGSKVTKWILEGFELEHKA